MLLLKRRTFEIESDSALVKSADAAAIAAAEDVVAAAEAEAAKIVEEAKVAYEAERQRGYADGIAAGREEMMMQKLDQLNASIEFMQNVETKMGELVIKALRKCVAEIDDRDLVCQIVRKSMQAIVRAQRQITIKVVPAMVPTVKERLQSILANFPSVMLAEVVEDAHLEGTACIVETEAGSVEASISGQLDAIEKSIRKGFQKDEAKE